MNKKTISCIFFSITYSIFALGNETEIKQKKYTEKLNTVIKNWEKNPDQTHLTNALWAVSLKHTPHKQQDFLEDMKALHASFHALTGQSVEDFKNFIEQNITKLNQKPAERQCLEVRYNFQRAYFLAQSSKEKENIKNSFAIQYFECKNQ